MHAPVSFAIYCNLVNEYCVGEDFWYYNGEKATDQLIT